MLEPLLSQLNNMNIVLASTSKQRAQLLKNLNLKFKIVASDYEENLDLSKYTPADFVLNTAKEKMISVNNKLKYDSLKPDIIISSDTMVAYKGKMYGKPHTEEDAFNCVKTLTEDGTPHLIHTAVCIWYKNQIHEFVEVTKVFMAQLTDEEVKAYVQTGEPMGKAGGYAIQGIASSFVTQIHGDFNNVVGLPLCKLALKLKEIVNS